MKRLDGTITLSILDEDNTQRMIFRIVPLCTKDGLVFQNQKASYPDYGSLRIIPDKREQSSFKERMREIGQLCCVQLNSNGKELTKIRQNRNYDPNQGECNQYAIYSDIICGFEENAVFEVFPEDQDYSQALTESVLLQRGKVLFGPLPKEADADWDTLKPFGNECYLMHTVEDLDGKQHTYYWNPDAIVTWRQRKKAMKHNAVPIKKSDSEPLNLTPRQTIQQEATQEQIPIGTKLEILKEDSTNEEHIIKLNTPVSDNANRLNHNEKPKSHTEEVPAESPHFHGTPIAESLKSNIKERTNGSAVQGVVERQLKEKQRNVGSANGNHRPVDNPIEMLRQALQNGWNIPALHQELFQLLGENKEFMQDVVQSSLIDGKTKGAYSAAKAELDAIEGERISLLIELDKVKANYQQIQEKMYTEMTRQKQNAIAKLDKHIEELKEEKSALETLLSALGENAQETTLEIYEKNKKLDVISNGSDITISPTIGCYVEPKELTENVRQIMSHMGFLCKQDCVMELLIFLSLYDEIYIYAANLWEAELYINNVLRALGLQSVTAWPSVFGTMRIISSLPENDMRTPTVEVIKNNRTPVRAYGHKTIRLIDRKTVPETSALPIVRAPELNKERSQEKLHENGKPISLQTLHAFSSDATMLHKGGEAWFDELEQKLSAQGLDIHCDIYHAMRVFARVTAPIIVGGFVEAADAAVMAWIVPILIREQFPKERLGDVIGNLPRCMNVMNGEPYSSNIQQP